MSTTTRTLSTDNSTPAPSPLLILTKGFAALGLLSIAFALFTPTISLPTAMALTTAYFLITLAVGAYTQLA